MSTLIEIRRCVSVLAQTPIGEWAETFVELRMDFYRKHQHPFVFSTRFGADFFDELKKAVEYYRYIQPSSGEILSEYDKNFNIWLKLIIAENEAYTKFPNIRRNVFRILLSNVSTGLF